MNKENKYKILVLIDVQNDFITGSLANKEAQRVLPNIVEKINNFSGDAIYLTMDTHFDNYLETNEGKHLPVKHCICGTKGWKVENTVKNAVINKAKEGVDVKFIPKESFGSSEGFKIKRYLPNIELNDYIRDDYSLTECISENICSIENPVQIEIEICGFCTDICVISNALILKAFYYDCIDFIVDSKCCAGVTPEKHEAALEVMRSCQINVI